MNSDKYKIKQKLDILYQKRDLILDEISVIESELAVSLALEKEQHESKKPISLLHENEDNNYYSPVKLITKSSSTQEKYELFISLFSGRPDVHAIRFQSNRSGKSGYSPACGNDFNQACCSKGMRGAKRISCRICEYSDFKPIDMEAFIAHTQGNKENCSDVLGAYPMDIDEMCSFIVADFDNENRSKNDAAIVNNSKVLSDMFGAAIAFKQTCVINGIQAHLERSRSGEGMHVWLFFTERITVRQARRLCTAILTKAMDIYPDISFNSYDRLIPNQDTLPEGGFGNLIALPLQGKAGRNGNSLFVDDDLRQYTDQWVYLSHIQKTTSDQVDQMVKKLSFEDDLGELMPSDPDEEGTRKKPWEKRKYGNKLTSDDFKSDVGIIRANMLYINKAGISISAINTIKRLAAFKNPDFFKAQAMRLPTYNKPRIISTSEETDEYIVIPRGAEEALIDLLSGCNAKFNIEDYRGNGKSLDVSFIGELRDDQIPAANALLSQDIGVLSAATAFGKTVIGAYMIATHSVNTLVLVHNRQLLSQWKNALNSFLDIKNEPPEKFTPTGRHKKVERIGEYQGSKKNLSGLIDIAMLQSLCKDGEVEDFVKDYGMVIVDECHHVPAFSFESVLKHINAKYVHGLTATPSRDDGHQTIIFLQCGPIRYIVDAKTQAEKRPFEHFLIPKFTRLLPTSVGENSGISVLLSDVASDDKRNKMIVSDVVNAIDVGRKSLVLTERTEHVSVLAELLSGSCENVIAMTGGMSTKEKRLVNEHLDAIKNTDKFVLIATGKYIGEGFDFPMLDTLFLALPIAWKGKVAQYIGRLHRIYEGKTDVKVYDYVDANIPVLDRMYHKRIKGYKANGYRIVAGETQKGIQSFIYGVADYLDGLKKDCSSARSKIVISSPNIGMKKIQSLIQVLSDKVQDNVEITVSTRSLSTINESSLESAHNCLSILREKGINVVEKVDIYKKFVIIDNQIVWYGSINPLGYTGSDDNMLRLEDRDVGESLLDSSDANVE